MAKQKFTAREIAEGILNQNKVVYNFLYSFYLPKTIAITCKNHGTKEDGEELFSDVIMAILNNYEAGKYIPENGAFDSYFNTIAKRLWINFLRKNGINTVNLDELDQHPEIKDDSLEAYKGKLYFLNKHMPKLKEIKQKALELRYLKGLGYLEIANLLKLSSDKYAKTVLHRSKIELRNLINNDPEYKDGDFDIDVSEANIPSLIIIEDMHKNKWKQKQSPKRKLPIKELLLTTAVAGGVLLVKGIINAFTDPKKSKKEGPSLLDQPKEIDQFPQGIKEKNKTV